jgi:hypothetical protein
MRMIGQAFSMAIVTLILAAFIGNEMLGQVDHLVLMKSIKIAFIIFTVLCIAGVFASLARGNTYDDARPSKNPQ